MKKRVINNGTLEIYDAENNVLLTISEQVVDDVLNIKLSGQILTETAHEFEDELFACIIVHKKVAIDFGGVTHISSMGLNALLSLQKILDDAPDSDLKLYNVNESVFEEFKDVGFDELFIIERIGE